MVDTGGADGGLGLGITWWPHTAPAIVTRRDLGFVELVAEHHRPGHLARTVSAARRRGLGMVVHGTSLSLGSVDRPSPARLAHLATLADEVGATTISEHAAFVRAGGVEIGHLTPLPRTAAALDVLVRNVRIAQSELPVPLAIENPAALFEWPDNEIDDARFLTELTDRTGCLLLLDLANAYVNSVNHGTDVMRLLDELPLDRIAYVHVAGGVARAGLLHDTHAHPLWRDVDVLVEELAAQVEIPGLLLERDTGSSTADLGAELDRLVAAWERGDARRRPAPPDRRAAAHPRSTPMSSTTDARDLLDRQRALALALTAGWEAPSGFAADRVAAASASLSVRRSRLRRRYRAGHARRAHRRER